MDRRPGDRLAPPPAIPSARATDGTASNVKMLRRQTCVGANLAHFAYTGK